MSVKVSIIIPVFNVAPYVEKCIESACNQTLKDIEIIAINDASTDNSLEILKKFAKQDSRVIVINHKKNTQTARSRNDGLDRATGEYVCFLDGDDSLDTEFCEKLYNLAKKENADIAKGVAKVVDGKKVLDIMNDNEKIRNGGKFQFMGYVWLCLYNRKNLIEKHNIRFYIDFFCFQIQTVYFANKIACDDTAFYNYLRREGSCDSEIFTIEKWVRLNLGHANFMYDWINNHDYTDDVRKKYLNMIEWLYFYGFEKLERKDIIQGCEILAENLAGNYNCGFDCSNINKLKRKLYRKNKKTTFFDYMGNILSHKL